MVFRASTAMVALLLLSACNTTQLSGALKNTVSATNNARSVVDEGTADYVRTFISLVESRAQFKPRLAVFQRHPARMTCGT